jgi:hypothetical protein
MSVLCFLQFPIAGGAFVNADRLSQLFLSETCEDTRCEQLPPSSDVRHGQPPCNGALIPIAASADTALAFHASYQAGQQRECSQAWPVGSAP